MLFVYFLPLPDLASYDRNIHKVSSRIEPRRLHERVTGKACAMPSDTVGQSDSRTFSLAGFMNAPRLSFSVVVAAVGKESTRL